jgi:hypothetical protein
MKNAQSLCIRLFIILLAAATTNVFALTTNPYYAACLMTLEGRSGSQLDPSGGAFVINGKAPKGFEGFESLSIETTKSKQNRDGSLSAVPIKPQGEVDFKGGRRYKAKSIYLNDDQLSLETQAIRGISYKFTGSFLKKEAFYATEPTEPVLKGQMMKLVNGKKVSEAPMTFYFETGG